MSDQNTAAQPTPTQVPAESVIGSAPPKPESAPAVGAPAVPAAAQPQQGTDPKSPAQPEPPVEEPGSDAGAVPKPDAYVLPEGMPSDLREFAAEQGFTQAQLDSTISQFAGYFQGIKHAEVRALRELGKAHVKNWGADGKKNLNLAQQALKQNDDEGGGFAKLLIETGWGDHPAALNFLYNIGRSMQEGGFLKSAVPRTAGQKTAAQALFGANHPSSQG